MVRDAVQGLRSRGGLPRAGRQDDRNPCQHAEVEAVGGLPGVQGSGQPPGGERKLVGEFRRGDAVVFGKQAGLLAGGAAVRVALPLAGAVCLGLAGA
ncbi:hypothetical protein OH738_40770 (plasmid) [Streptomyces hirsutus]|uniref:hypothetical protein n=1 Tax=Streptomyces hirsutus TaxID=35620 RepID=UPI002F90EA25|nr:hypothetical protein OH738_40770 [Streptomyces hirsutus]